MLVYEDGRIVGTVGGGKLEALAIGEAVAALRSQLPVLKAFPLHESDVASFGAICGGEVTLLIEPQAVGEALFIVGGGHCGRAIAKLARECNFHVTVIEDRAELLADFPAQRRITGQTAPEFIVDREWRRKRR
jgi:xanthine dehydrogenase accessory factor